MDHWCPGETTEWKTLEHENPSNEPFEPQQSDTPLLLKRWLQSAVDFRPSPFNTFIPPEKLAPRHIYQDILYTTFHGKEELDAAETLTFLSRKVKEWGYTPTFCNSQCKCHLIMH